MDKKVYLSMLLDYYGKLLTEKQRIIINLWLNEDLTLGEISQELGISRQGVHDFVKKAEEQLNYFEERLGLVKNFIIKKEKTLELQKIAQHISEKYKNDSDIYRLLTLIQEWLRDDI